MMTKKQNGKNIKPNNPNQPTKCSHLPSTVQQTFLSNDVTSCSHPTPGCQMNTTYTTRLSSNRGHLCHLQNPIGKVIKATAALSQWRNSPAVMEKQPVQSTVWRYGPNSSLLHMKLGASGEIICNLPPVFIFDNGITGTSPFTLHL